MESVLKTFENTPSMYVSNNTSLSMKNVRTDAVKDCARQVLGRHSLSPTIPVTLDLRSWQRQRSSRRQQLLSNILQQDFLYSL